MLGPPALPQVPTSHRNRAQEAGKGLNTYRNIFHEMILMALKLKATRTRQFSESLKTVKENNAGFPSSPNKFALPPLFKEEPTRVRVFAN